MNLIKTIIKCFLIDVLMVERVDDPIPTGVSCIEVEAKQFPT